MITISGNKARTLVLSGGGFAGGAWMFGLIDGLGANGVDLGDADLIVGTSAGARVGAALATGAFNEVADMYRHSQAPTAETSVRLDEFVAASMRILAEVGDRQDAARRIANLAPLGPRLVAEADHQQFVLAHLRGQAWPKRRLAIVAVDAESGHRVSFEADSGVPLPDALTASSSLPGIYPLARINGHSYADGGVHSLYNADLASGYDVVIVLSAMRMNEYLQGQLDSEVAQLGPAAVHVIVADEASLAAIGPDPLAPGAGLAAFDAGISQAEHEIANLRPVWRTHQV